MTDLVGLVRYASGVRAELEPLAPDVNRRFELWLGREKRAGRVYSHEQLEWLRLMRDWVANNAEVTMEDVRDASDFAPVGATARARHLFGTDDLPTLLDTLTDTLVA